MVFKKIIFQNRYVALETPSRPPPFMAIAILNFHFDFPHTSLRSFKDMRHGQYFKKYETWARFYDSLHLQLKLVKVKRFSIEFFITRTSNQFLINIFPPHLLFICQQQGRRHWDEKTCCRTRWRRGFWNLHTGTGESRAWLIIIL